MTTSKDLNRLREKSLWDEVCRSVNPGQPSPNFLQVQSSAFGDLQPRFLVTPDVPLDPSGSPLTNSVVTLTSRPTSPSVHLAPRVEWWFPTLGSAASSERWQTKSTSSLPSRHPLPRGSWLIDPSRPYFNGQVRWFLNFSLFVFDNIVSFVSFQNLRETLCKSSIYIILGVNIQSISFRHFGNILWSWVKNYLIDDRPLWFSEQVRVSPNPTSSSGKDSFRRKRVDDVKPRPSHSFYEPKFTVNTWSRPDGETMNHQYPSRALEDLESK